MSAIFLTVSRPTNRPFVDLSGYMGVVYSVDVCVPVCESVRDRITASDHACLSACMSVFLYVCLFLSA